MHRGGREGPLSCSFGGWDPQRHPRRKRAPGGSHGKQLAFGGWQRFLMVSVLLLRSANFWKGEVTLVEMNSLPSRGEEGLEEVKG